MKNRKMPAITKSYKCLGSFVMDLFCISIVGIPILIFFAKGKPFQRGFYCDDESIRYPYKDSTISNKVLYSVGVLFPVSVVVVIEILRFYTGKTNYKSPLMYRYKIPPVVWQIYQVIWVFAFGACVSQLITDIAKYSIGRLRPHFIDVCKPSINVDKCNDSHRYILPTEFYCTNSDTFRVRESRLSFMSGHASFSAYCMVFVALYLEARFTWNCNRLLKPFLQVVVLLAAYYTALSRVSDYKHHWSDVLVGSLQGIIVAVLVVLFISKLFPKFKDEEDDSSNSSKNTFSKCKTSTCVESERSSV